MNARDPHEDARQKLAAMVQAFQPVGPSRHAKLLPFKEQIRQLRAKGAAYGAIRTMLATVGVSVSIDTLGRFCREELELRDPAPARSSNRSRRSRNAGTRPSALPLATAGDSHSGSVSQPVTQPTPVPSSAATPTATTDPTPALTPLPFGTSEPHVAEVREL